MLVHIRADGIMKLEAVTTARYMCLLYGPGLHSGTIARQPSTCVQITIQIAAKLYANYDAIQWFLVSHYTT